MTHAKVHSNFDRVAQLRVRHGRGVGVGSGYLLTDRLVLTAAHVVEGEDERVAVQFASGVRSTGLLLWSGRAAGGPDAALVELDAPPIVAGGTPLIPVRFGRLTGQSTGVKASSMGFPRVLRAADGERIPEHLSGTVNPGTERGEQYHVNLVGRRPAPSAGGASPWSGMSGGALFADGANLLIGVVAIDLAAFEGGRLTAVPVWRLIEDEAYAGHLREHGATTEIESVELASLLTSPWRRGERLSPARLLGAEAEVVPFRGRESSLSELSDWCASEEPFGVRLITGPGGQGKTRLALALNRRMRSAGWVAGFVKPDAPRRAVEALPDTCVPVLLIVDYAETRTEQLERMINTMWERPAAARMRLVLLARSDAEWWEQLRRNLREALQWSRAWALEPLEDEVGSRIEAYREAVDAFVARLPGDGRIDWPQIARDTAVPELGDPRFASVLTLHMTALGNLLQSADRVAEVGGDLPEDLLLAHEQRYWMGSVQGLVHDHVTLRLAVAAAALCGAADITEATTTLRRLAALADVGEERRRSVARWLHELYPVSDGRYWGPLQPDRLGERLVEMVSADEPGLVEALLNGASDAQRELGLTVVVRLANRLHAEGSRDAAQVWYEQAARRGHAEAAYQLGYLLRGKGDRDQAERWWVQAGAAGHLDAAYSLGQMLEEPPSKPVEARAWFERAARAGHLDAACHLGTLAQADASEAMRWFELAAAHGHRDAAYRLGRLLIDGGERKDALDWWRVAAELVPEAALALGRALREDGEIAEAETWYERAAAHGWNQAAFELGRFAEEEGDAGRAAGWWWAAAASGHSDAAFRLAGLLWELGHPDEAAPLYEQAAREGHARAAYQLGWVWKKRGSAEETVRWWRQAAAAGEVEAAEWLATEFGETIPEPGAPVAPAGAAT